MHGDVGEIVSEFDDKQDIACACTLVSGTNRWCSLRTSYPENGCTTHYFGTKCVCDTDLCNDEVTVTPSPPVECYECYGCDQPTDETCTGEVCIKDTSCTFTTYGVL